MTEPTVICPNCKTEIKLTESLAAPLIETICPPLLYRQGSRIVLAGYGNAAGGVRATAQIDRSADGGRTWANGPDSCGGKDGYASTLALAPPSALVLLCKHQMARPDGTFGPAWVRISTDGGATFGAAEHLPLLPVTARGTITDYQLAAASPARLLAVQTGTSGSRLLRSGNGGRSWITSLRFPGGSNVLLVGFEDPRTARVAQGDTVWTTRDAGQTWRADHFTG